MPVSSCTSVMPPERGSEILEIIIPGLVKSLLARCAREEQYHAEELRIVREGCAAEVARAQASEAEWIADACSDWRDR